MAEQAVRNKLGLSRFSASLIDLLDRVQYRRVPTEDRFDPVYRLRYEIYRRELPILPFNSEQVNRDVYDGAPNCFCYGVYMDEQLVGSIRLHISTPEMRLSPSLSLWPNVLNAMLSKGEKFIESSQLVIDQDATLSYPALPYLALRIAIMAGEHFSATYLLTPARPEHGAFYKRILGSASLAGEVQPEGHPNPVRLYGSHLPSTLPRILARFPFWTSTGEERNSLFSASAGVGFGIPPTARAITHGGPLNSDTATHGREDRLGASAAQDLAERDTSGEIAQIIAAIARSASVDEQAALQWYETVKIPAFGGETADQVVRSGRADLVWAYVNHLADGGYA